VKSKTTSTRADLNLHLSVVQDWHHRHHVAVNAIEDAVEILEFD
jgi:hypothetical protein